MARDQTHGLRRIFLPPGGPARPDSWQPLADVYRTPDGWMIKGDLAGVRPEDVTISVQGSRLVIRGTRHDCTLDEGCCHYRLEIAYSRFERAIELPDNVEHAQVTTEFREGMLLVRIRTEAP